MKNLIKVLTIITIVISLISCSTKEKKISGIKKNRRLPVYNEKFISKAKKNVMQNGIDEEEDDDDEYIDYQGEDPSLKNQKMYLKMLRRDRVDFNSRKRKYKMDDDEDENLYQTRRRIDSRNVRSKNDLERELNDIKSLLKETRQEIEKAKCPYTEIEEKKKQLRNKAELPKVVSPRPGSMTIINN